MNFTRAPPPPPPSIAGFRRRHVDSGRGAVTAAKTRSSFGSVSGGRLGDNNISLKVAQLSLLYKQRCWMLLRKVRARRLRSKIYTEPIMIFSTVFLAPNRKIGSCRNCGSTVHTNIIIAQKKKQLNYDGRARTDNTRISSSIVHTKRKRHEITKRAANNERQEWRTGKLARQWRCRERGRGLPRARARSRRRRPT